MSINTLKETVKKTEMLFSAFSSKRIRGKGHKLEHRKYPKNIRNSTGLG